MRANKSGRDDIDTDAQAQAALEQARALPPGPEEAVAVRKAAPVWQWAIVGLLVLCLVSYVTWMFEIATLPDIVRKVAR